MSCWPCGSKRLQVKILFSYKEFVTEFDQFRENNWERDSIIILGDTTIVISQLFYLLTSHMLSNDSPSMKLCRPSLKCPKSRGLKYIVLWKIDMLYWLGNIVFYGFHFKTGNSYLKNKSPPVRYYKPIKKREHNIPPDNRTHSLTIKRKVIIKASFFRFKNWNVFPWKDGVVAWRCSRQIRVVSRFIICA